MKPVISRFAETRQKIGRAAYEIIRREGVAGLSMRKLARTQYMSPSNLYEYFDSREAIVAYVFTTTVAALTAHIELVDMDLPPRDYIIALCLAYYDFAQTNQSHMLVLFDTAQTTGQVRHRESNKTSSDFFALLDAGVERYLQGGRPPQLSSQEIVYTLFALTSGVAAGNARDLQMVSRATVHAAIQTFLTGLDITS